MNLSHPTALFWSALAVPIVVFYILKVRLRRVPVSTILFWDQVFEEKRPRSLWQKLRHLVSLLVQLAFLLLLVLALAEPYFPREALRARRLVLVIDNSASMNADDVAPTRLARARREAARIIDGLRFLDEVAIVSAGSEPRVRCGLTGHQRTLRTALAAIAATDGPTRVQDAVTLARRVLADAKDRKVIVLTDGGFDDAPALAKGPDVELIAVGTRAGNVGITRLQVRRSPIDPIGYQVLAEVVNASDRAVECRLEIDLEQQVVDVVPLKLAAGERWHQTFEKTSAEGGRLSLTLDHADALAVDNRAVALLPRREVRRVALVTAGNLFLEKVLEANPLVELSVGADLPAPPPPASVTVFHRKVPGRLPPGPVLVVEPAGSCDLWELGGTLQDPIVAGQDGDSPLLANVKLANVYMPEARKIVPKGPAKLLASTVAGDPLLCAFERPEGRVLVLSVNLEKGDLPLQTAFPILVANALAWFAGTTGELIESRPTGSIAEVELPGGHSLAGAGHLAVRSPDGVTRPLAVAGDRALIGPLDRCGIWSVVGRPAAAGSGAGAGPVLEVACNLSSGRESDLRLPEGLAGRREAEAAGFGGWPAWFALIAAAWLLTCAEWVLYQRRWIS